MNRVQDSVGGLWDKARLVMYGLVLGLILGLILGWIFHRVVSTIFWVALILVPITLALLFYQRVTSRNKYERGRDDDRLVVRSNDPDRIVVTREEPAGGVIRDAEWRDSR